MTSVKHPVKGRKATRTVTAPSLMSPSERKRLLSVEVPSARFCGPDLQFAHCQSLDELNGRQSTFSPQALHPPTRTEVESRYSVSQQLKDIMETIIPTDNSNMLMERHRREVTRCWSRERVVRNEVILSIRCPNDSGLDYAYSRSNIYSGTSELYKSATCINTNSDSWFDQLGQSTRSVSTRSLGPTIALIGRPVPVYVNGKSESNVTSDKGTVAFTCLEQPYKQDNQLLLASPRLTQSLEGKEELSGHTGIVQTSNSSSERLFDDLSSIDLTAECDHGRRKLPEEASQCEWNPDQLLDRISISVRDSVAETEFGSILQALSGTAVSLAASEDSSSSSLYSTACSSLSTDTPTSVLEDNVEMETEGQTLSGWTSLRDGTRSDGETQGARTVVYFRTTVQRDSTGYGLRVCGNKPVSVHSVRQGGTAEKAGLQPGDQIIQVNGHVVDSICHDDVVARIKEKPTVYFLLRRLQLNTSPPNSPSGTEQENAKFHRQLTVNEDPVLRSQSRRYNHKRRSSRDSVKRSSATVSAIHRRAMKTVSAFEPLHDTSQSQTDSASDSPGHYTDEDLQFQTDNQTTSVPGGDHESTVGTGTSRKDTGLPRPESTLLRSRPSFGRSDRSLKGRSVNLSPTEPPKRSSLKESPLLSTQDVANTAAKELRDNRSHSTNVPPCFSSLGSAAMPDESTEHKLRSSPLASEERNSIQDQHQSGSSSIPLPTFKTVAPVGHVMGRNFDDDSDEDVHVRDELSSLSSLFENASTVLNSPAKCGVFLNYLFNQNRNPSPALFWIATQHFHCVTHTLKELTKDQKRISIELFSTFLHEKSPLRLDLPTYIASNTLEKIQSSAGPLTFQAAADAAVGLVQPQVSKLAQEIRHGMETWKPPECINLLLPRTREEELTVFELVLTPRLCSLYQQLGGADPTLCDSSSWSSIPLPEPYTPTFRSVTSAEEVIQALLLSLVTAYRYFSSQATGGAMTPETIDGAGIIGSTARGSLFTRSVENLTASATAIGVGSTTGSIGGGLTAAGNSLWTKLPHFCSKVKTKSHGYLFGNRKVKYSHRNHSLTERPFERPVECGVCGQLLWGLSPQGLACNNCDLCVHNKCKLGIREACTKENRKSGIPNAIPITTTNGTQSPPDMPPLAPHAVSCTRTHSFAPTVLSTGGAVDVLSDGITDFSYSNTWNARKRRFRDRLNRPLDELFHSRRHLRSSMTNLESARDESSFALGARENTPSPRNPLLNASFGALNSDELAGGILNVTESTPLASTQSVSIRPSTSDTVSLETSYGEDRQQSTQNKSIGDEQMDTDIRLVSQMRSRFEPDGSDLTNPPSRSDSHASCSSVLTGQSLSLDLGSPCSTASDVVPELVITNWSDDPEMIAGESFEAACELRRHFPDYQMPTKGAKSEDYIRTLCLLEFHQKTQYMVRHLKQYHYLLLRRWPPEHNRLAEELCLDRIPILIQLFRSLVNCINATKMPQGYVGMAEAVLAWLTDNGNCNLKTWARHCQALSCSNMLDCVHKWVRDYTQRHPDILPLLQTRHNKFVLLDGLKHMRILYFNLPLIANNIVKDLEKKTKSYKAEAKLWQKIYGHLASLPQTIDDVCMPLVKRINSGQLHSSLDKKDALFRQNNPVIAPFRDLLLNFPRMLFRHWVVAHAEVGVDKLTVTSANKINLDYIRERTDMLAILLHNALLLLVKDNDKFVLRAFKAAREHAGGGSGVGATAVADRIPLAPSPSPHSEKVGASGSTHLSSYSFTSSTTSSSPQSTYSTGSVGSSIGSSLYVATTGSVPGSGPSAGLQSGLLSPGASEKAGGSSNPKLPPVISLHNMYTSCGEKFGAEHLLNIVSMDPTVLVRLLFYQEKQRQHWFTLLKEYSPIASHLVASLQQQRAKHAMKPSKSINPLSPGAVSEPAPQLPVAVAATSTPASAPVINTLPELDSSRKLRLPLQMEQKGKLVSTSSTSSLDESIPPIERVHMAISACNRVNQQMRQALCETLHISDEEYAIRCQNPDLRRAKDLDDLVLLQMNLTQKWLAFVSRSVTIALRTRTSSVASTPTRQRVSRSVGPEDRQLGRKRPRVSSLTAYYRSEGDDGMAHVCSGERSPETSPCGLTKGSLVLSAPNLDNLSPELSISHRRRSTQDFSLHGSHIELRSITTPTQARLDAQKSCLEQMGQLATQIVAAVCQFTHLTEGKNFSYSESDITGPQKTTAGLRSGLVEGMQIPSEETSSVDDFTVSHIQTKVETLKPPETRDRSETLRPTNAYSVEPQEDPQVQKMEAGNCPFGIASVSPNDQPFDPTGASILNITEGSNDSDSSHGLNSTRDSGCLQSGTDEEDDDDETIEDGPVPTRRASSSPTEDAETQLTPTTIPGTATLSFDQEDPSRDTKPAHLRHADDAIQGALVYQSECSTQPSQTSVNRNDSQKSTTSSGFVESGED